MKYVYKIVAAIGALAVIPMTLFSKIFYFNFSSVAVQVLSFILQLKGNETIEEIMAQNGGQLPESIAESLSVYDIYSLYSKVGNLAENIDSANGKFDAIITPILVFAVIAVLLIICAVVTAIFAFVVKDNRKVIYSSISGIGLSLMLNEAFDAISAPILDGTISLSTLLESWWSGLLGDIDILTLTTNFWFIPAIFGAVILWTVLYNYTLPENEKRERKLFLGEADD